MRSLIVEDDFISRKILQAYLNGYGECHIATTGTEAIEAFKQAWNEARAYDLICMDIMMAELNGQDALRAIRAIEYDMGLREDQKAKVIMTTGLSATKEVVRPFTKGAPQPILSNPWTRRKSWKS